MPGRPPFPRERSADAVRRHESILEDLQEQCRVLEFAVGEEGFLAGRARFLLVHQRGVEQEFHRVSASAAAFEGLVAGVQRQGTRVEREVEELKERVGKQVRRISVLEDRVRLLESEQSSAFQRRIERIEAVARSQEKRLRSCEALAGLEEVSLEEGERLDRLVKRQKKK